MGYLWILLGVTVVVLSLSFRYLFGKSVKLEVLNEGLFDGKEDRAINFYDGKEYIVFYFSKRCRRCIETGRIDPEELVIGGCHEPVLTTARNRSSFEPKEGDPIRIIVWKNLFGQVLEYEIVKSDFAEEFKGQLLNIKEPRGYLIPKVRRSPDLQNKLNKFRWR